VSESTTQFIELTLGISAADIRNNNTTSEY